MKDKILTINLFIFFLFSVVGIYYTSFIKSSYQNLYIKQVVFFIIGIAIFNIIKTINLKWLTRNIRYIYWINILLLVLVLFCGKKVNGSTSWFEFSFFSFQPSELMKVILVLYLAIIINNQKESELKRFIKCLMITIIPSIFTFVAPDTGIVICYIVSLIFILFGSKIKIKWFLLFCGFCLSVLITIIVLIYIKPSVLNNNVSYRLNRIIEMDNYQLNNALIGIGSSGFSPRFNSKYIIYIIESPTDFIFATISTYCGFIITLLLLVNIYVFDYHIIKLIKNNRYKNSYIYGFLGVFLYHQIEHIFMNMGLFPITGITLPFVSYGGSSLISGMIILGFLYHD